MIQHSGDGCFGGVVGSGWPPPTNTAAVRVCSRVNGTPLKVRPLEMTRIRYTPSVARTVAASNRPGCVSVIPMVAVAPAGSVSAMVTAARWSTGTPYSSSAAVTGCR